jgi:hypothetical protein
MKNISVLVGIFLLCSLAHATHRTATLIMPRSCGTNNARDMAGWEHYINNRWGDGWYGAFAVTPEVTLSFRPERIAQCLFGDAMVTCKNILTISGSQITRRKDDWLADYFGLPTDFKSTIEYTPHISNSIVDVTVWLGCDPYVPGLYLQLQAPLVYTRWDLGLCETLVSTGSNADDPGYFSATAIERAQLTTNFTSFMSGNDAPKVADLTFNSLAHAKMVGHAQRLMRLCDIRTLLGWNALATDDYHLGFNLCFIIPTGNRPSGEFLFEPIIGNGHHWEAGGGLSAHIILWEDMHLEEKAGFYFEATITHLFTTRQQRSFDLRCSNNSRYMLAERMTSTISNGLGVLVDSTVTIPTAQYVQEVTSVANLTTIPVDVAAAVQADLALMLSYTKAKNSWGFGFNFWGRSCETTTVCEHVPFDIDSWALKGDAMVFGFQEGTQTPVALSATQRNATIAHGLDFASLGATTVEQIAAGQQNSNSDNAVSAVADTGGDLVFLPLRTSPSGTTQINTSFEPLLLTKSDIDTDSARTRGQSYKLFSHFTHTITLPTTRPYLSMGAEIEFGQRASSSNTVKPAPSCVNTAVSLWGVWIKTGLAF